MNKRNTKQEGNTLNAAGWTTVSFAITSNIQDGERPDSLLFRKTVLVY